MNAFTFNNRDSYIAFRVEWKANYEIISQAIRDLKFQYCQDRAAGKYSPALYELIRKRREANNMMALLFEAKQESARQWAANRKGEAA